MTGANPTDRGKLGTKRHVLTDQSGIPLFVTITSANTHDMKAAIDTLHSVIFQRPSYKQNLCLDKGYDFPEIEKEIIKRKYTTHIHRRGEEGKELLIKKILGSTFKMPPYPIALKIVDWVCRPSRSFK